jgi:hypothetical protein
MREVNGKREIEAVCDTWEGGLIEYLKWKIKQFLEHWEEEENGINLVDLQETTLDDNEMDGIYDI